MLVRKEDIASEETRYFKSGDVTPLCTKVDYGVQYVGIQSVLSEQVENATSPEHFVKKKKLNWAIAVMRPYIFTSRCYHIMKRW